MVGSDAQRPRPFGLTGPLGGFRPLDRIFAGYVALSALALLVGVLRGAAGCREPLLIDLGILAGLVALVRLTRDSYSRALAFLRLSFPPLLLVVLFRQVQVIWPVFRGRPLDGFVADAEAALFHCQPALVFQARAPYAAVSEIFCFAYFAYYFFPVAVALTLLLRRGYLAAERALLATVACFLSCYAFFWLFPTVGPHYWFPPHAGPQLYQGWLFNKWLFFLTSRGEILGGAFPSSHIAVAVLLTVYARREAPRLFPFLLAITILMCPAVVYVRAHYALDALAGIPLGLLFARAVGTSEAVPDRARQAA